MLRCASPWYLSLPSSFSASPVHFITTESLVSSPSFYPIIPILVETFVFFILLQLATVCLFPLIFLLLLHVFYTVDRALLSKTELSLFTPKKSWSACHALGIVTGPRDSWGFKHHRCSGVATEIYFCNTIDGSILFHNCTRLEYFREHRSNTTKWELVR